jgi:hypothetical protein
MALTSSNATLTPAHRRNQGWVNVGLAASLIAAALFPIGLLNLGPRTVHVLAFMLFGPTFLIGAVGLRHYFAREVDSVGNDVAWLSLALSGLSFTFMATMQASIYSIVPQLARATPEPSAATWSAILRSVSSTQLGLDFAFDIFMSLGVLFLAVQLLRHPRYPRWFGILGIAVTVAGFTMNVLAFPHNPDERGLVDLAWGYFVWLMLAVLPILRWRRVTARVAP